MPALPSVPLAEGEIIGHDPFSSISVFGESVQTRGIVRERMLMCGNNTLYKITFLTLANYFLNKHGDKQLECVFTDFCIQAITA